MQITQEEKSKLFKKYGNNEADTGSTESQIAWFTERIVYLTNHLKSHKKDFDTQRSLLKLVGKRKRLLNYLKNNDINKYRELIKELKIRK